MHTQNKKVISLLAIGLGVLLSPFYGNVAVALSASDCSQDLLLSFFPEVFVKESLEENEIPKDKWDAILKELAVRDKDLIKKVEAKAAQMDPNPLKEQKDPVQRAAAVKLFRDTLQENFTAAFNANGITDNEVILTILDEVQEKRAKRFEECMKQGNIRPPQPQAPVNPETPSQKSQQASQPSAQR